MDWIEIGKIVAAQGLKGELRVYPDSDFPERFETAGQRWLLRPGQLEPEAVQLLSGRYLENKGLYVITLAGITNRDQAEALRNSQLLVPATDRLPLEAGEFHVADLIGLAVVDQASQRQVGVVTDLLSAGNDLLEVELTPEPTLAPDQQQRKKATVPQKVLIPFVEAIVPVVDLAQGRIEITPPAGLIAEIKPEN
jgi:16S rRNA processing protein RimM